MLSEKDCRQLSSAAQQGQDTSTRGVKGTQETPTSTLYTYFPPHPSSLSSTCQLPPSPSHIPACRACLKIVFVYQKSGDNRRMSFPDDTWRSDREAAALEGGEVLWGGGWTTGLESSTR